MDLKGCWIWDTALKNFLTPSALMISPIIHPISPSFFWCSFSLLSFGAEVCAFSGEICEAVSDPRHWPFPAGQWHTRLGARRNPACHPRCLLPRLLSWGHGSHRVEQNEQHGYQHTTEHDSIHVEGKLVLGYLRISENGQVKEQVWIAGGKMKNAVHCLNVFLNKAKNTHEHWLSFAKAGHKSNPTFTWSPIIFQHHGTWIHMQDQTPNPKMPHRADHASPLDEMLRKPPGCQFPRLFRTHSCGKKVKPNRLLVATKISSTSFDDISTQRCKKKACQGHFRVNSCVPRLSAKPDCGTRTASARNAFVSSCRLCAWPCKTFRSAMGTYEEYV